MVIPVIDLFAGPGGLGEGFSSLRRDGRRVFQIKLSIEKDEYAHRTLELRLFFHQFPDGHVPEAYYDYLRGKIAREALFAKYPAEAQAAREEAWWAELGGEEFSDALIDERIEKALGGSKMWVLIGGPPCQAYSLAGRARVIGGEGRAKYEADSRHYLYRHYLRILAVHRPAVFVMENVKGLLSATVKEQRILEQILRDLEQPLTAVYGRTKDDQPNYRLVSLVRSSNGGLGQPLPEDFVVRAEDYGIPQARHRVIILGIRADIQGSPRLLARKPQVPIESAIGDLPKLRSGISGGEDDLTAWTEAVKSIAKACWLEDAKVDAKVRRGLRTLVEKLDSPWSLGGEFVAGESQPAFAPRWIRDGRLGGFCNHASRHHICGDLHRYAFAAVFAKEHGRSPKLEDFPAELLPNHRNVAEALKGAKFNDRFRVQFEGRPSTTIVSHISKDGHYYIHYDPKQCRSLTVREAARLQTFPDNYFFEGPRTQQYLQVGNAVPPLLARQIAVIVAKLLTGS